MFSLVTVNIQKWLQALAKLGVNSETCMSPPTTANMQTLGPNPGALFTVSKWEGFRSGIPRGPLKSLPTLWFYEFKITKRPGPEAQVLYSQLLYYQFVIVRKYLVYCYCVTTTNQGKGWNTQLTILLKPGFQTHYTWTISLWLNRIPIRKEHKLLHFLKQGRRNGLGHDLLALSAGSFHALLSSSLLGKM